MRFSKIIVKNFYKHTQSKINNFLIQINDTKLFMNDNEIMITKYTKGFLVRRLAAIVI
jgi:hypothetical protein